MRLVITEKPSVARSIAAVIGAGKKQKGYLEGTIIWFPGASGISWSWPCPPLMMQSMPNGEQRICRSCPFHASTALPRRQSYNSTFCAP